MPDSTLVAWANRSTHSGKETQMGRPAENWTYNYKDIEKLVAKSSINMVHQAKSRGYFDPNDFKSVIFWIARHAKPEIKRELLEYIMATHELPKLR